MIKEKYLIVDHMWWCSPAVGEGTHEAEVVGSNPGNVEKYCTRAYSRKKIARLASVVGKNICLIFIHTANIYFSDGLLPVTFLF